MTFISHTPETKFEIKISKIEKPKFGGLQPRNFYRKKKETWHVDKVQFHCLILIRYRDNGFIFSEK